MAGLTKAQRAEKAIQAKAVELSALTADEFCALSEGERQSFVDKARLAFNPESDLGDDEDEIDNSHLIRVTKDGDSLSVHPTALADHKRLGWKEA